MTIPISKIKKAIKDRCHNCAFDPGVTVGGITKRKCGIPDCPLCDCLPPDSTLGTTSKSGLLATVRRYCADCCCTTKDVCSTFECSLFPYRMGERSKQYAEFLADQAGYVERMRREFFETYKIFRSGLKTSTEPKKKPSSVAKGRFSKPKDAPIQPENHYRPIVRYVLDESGISIWGYLNTELIHRT